MDKLLTKLKTIYSESFIPHLSEAMQTYTDQVYLYPSDRQYTLYTIVNASRIY
jgi:hypothetical protein